MNLQSAIDHEITREREQYVSGSPIPLDDHWVQFYENEDYLSGLVSTFLCAGFEAGEPAVVVASESRRRAFCARLATAGVDVEGACRSGQLTLLDARETLSELLVDGAPDRERFRKVVGGLIADRVNAAPLGSMRAYGEMVDVLWQGGHRDAALRLEQMWNDLKREQPIKLLCAYAMDGFGGDAAGLHDICRAHGSVLPLEHPPSPARTESHTPAPAARSAGQTETALRSSLRELRLAEHDLRERERENHLAHKRAELLYALLDGVVDAKTLDDVFAAALDVLGTALETPRSSILVFDAQGTMRFRAWRGLSDPYRRAVEGHSPWARDAQNPEPILVPNVATDPAMTGYLPLFRTEGIGALAFVPLVAGGRLIGKFMVYYDRPRVLKSHELELARAIANHVAAAITRFSAVHELEQAVRFNEMFTAILGHDLRNPLGGILATAEMAIRRPESERMLTPLNRIISSGQRMARMIDQLLDFTRARLGGSIPLQPKRIDVLPLARQALDELAVAHHDWAFRLDHAGDTKGVWDDDRLCQILSNLVGNAVQHGQAACGVNVHIDGTVDQILRIRVHNAGVVPEELLPRLFEPMTGGERRRAKSNGLGLGLFITQQIARAHGGHVEVESAEDTGTSFTVSLPRVTAGCERAA